MFNLYGTSFEEASEWICAPRKRLSVQDFSRGSFGENDLKTRFVAQIPGCLSPFIDMRNAVEHPEGHSGTLHMQNFTIDAEGNLQAPVWWREKDDKTEYGPIRILADIQTGVHNLLIAGEDIPVMWAIQHLLLLQLTAITVKPEQQRDPACAIKYTVGLRDSRVTNLA